MIESKGLQFVERWKPNCHSLLDAVSLELAHSENGGQETTVRGSAVVCSVRGGRMVFRDALDRHRSASSATFATGKDAGPCARAHL